MTAYFRIMEEIKAEWASEKREATFFELAEKCEKEEKNAKLRIFESLNLEAIKKKKKKDEKVGEGGEELRKRGVSWMLWHIAT